LKSRSKGSIKLLAEHHSNLNNTYANLEKCDNLKCLPQYGHCSSETTCICNKYYAHFLLNSGEISCSYKRKNQMIAFLLEFFIPFGAGHFYLGNIALGIIKLSFMLCLPIIFIFMNYTCGNFNSRRFISKPFLWDKLFVFYMISLLLWVFFDIVNISLMKYTDSNGVQMQPWR